MKAVTVMNPVREPRTRECAICLEACPAVSNSNKCPSCATYLVIHDSCATDLDMYRVERGLGVGQEACPLCHASHSPTPTGGKRVARKCSHMVWACMGSFCCKCIMRICAVGVIVTLIMQSIIDENGTD